MKSVDTSVKTVGTELYCRSSENDLLRPSNLNVEVYIYKPIQRLTVELGYHMSLVMLLFCILVMSQLFGPMRMTGYCILFGLVVSIGITSPYVSTGN